MSTTLEVRPSLPYVSHLKIVKYPSLSWESAGKNEQGQDLARQVANQPSIQVEITNYIGNEKAFATPFTFYSRDFLQTKIDEFKAIEKPPQQVTAAIAMIEKRLVDEKLWLEDVLESAGIPELEGLWSDAFSSSLDTFPAWAESTTPIGGIPVYMRQLEWDARLDLESNKAVTVTMGLYPTAACDSEMPVRKYLQFEDGVTRRQRESTISQLETLIADRTAALVMIDQIKVALALPLGATRTATLAGFNQDIVNKPDLNAYRAQVEQEKAGYSQQLASLQAVTYGTILSLLSTPSVAGSIKNLIIAIIATLKANVAEWANLDMAIVEQRFFLPPVE